jgi:hypothetical protein
MGMVVEKEKPGVGRQEDVRSQALRVKLDFSKKTASRRIF